MQSCLHFVQKIKKKSCIILRVSSFRPPFCAHVLHEELVVHVQAVQSCSGGAAAQNHIPAPHNQLWSRCFPAGQPVHTAHFPLCSAGNSKRAFISKIKKNILKKKKIHALLLKAVQEGSKQAKMKTILARILRIRCGFRRREKKGIRLGVCALRVCGSPKFGAAELNM